MKSYEQFCRSVKGKSGTASVNTDSHWSITRVLFCICDSGVARCHSQLTQVSLLANELDVRSVLRGQVRLAAFNHICVIHEAMNGCKNLQVH